MEKKEEKKSLLHRTEALNEPWIKLARQQI